MGFKVLFNADTLPPQTPQSHLLDLMEAYRFDQADLIANRTGQITQTQYAELKKVRSTGFRLILLFLLICIGTIFFSLVVRLLPREAALVGIIFLPLLALQLLLELVKALLYRQWQINNLNAYLKMGEESAFSTGLTTYTYLYSSNTTGWVNRWRRVGLVRRAAWRSEIVQAEQLYRVYYAKRGSLSYVLSLEPVNPDGTAIATI